MQKFNEHGVLITVASLIFIVVYAEECYDEWDLVISVIGAIFGIRFLWQDTSGDSFSRVIASFIGATGTIIAITAGSVLLPSVPNLPDFMEANPWGLSNMFVIAAAISVPLFFLKRLSR